MNIKPLVKDFIKPEYKSNSSGGMDIYFQEDVELKVGKDNVVNLGFCAEVPEGHIALLLPRSSAGMKGLHLRNTAGVIDSDYRGEWIAHITYDDINTWGETIKYKRGERALQALIIPVKQETINIVDEVSVTDRGNGGFGSTGK